MYLKTEPVIWINLCLNVGTQSESLRGSDIRNGRYKKLAEVLTVVRGWSL